jgi:hypothetical protein
MRDTLCVLWVAPADLDAVLQLLTAELRLAYQLGAEDDLTQEMIRFESSFVLRKQGQLVVEYQVGKECPLR